MVCLANFMPERTLVIVLSLVAGVACFGRFSFFTGIASMHSLPQNGWLRCKTRFAAPISYRITVIRWSMGVWHHWGSSCSLACCYLWFRGCQPDRDGRV